jgi:sterol desaturase/sphingolipid hydroxylase (fatty acid hydroxylase superfamily)
MGIDLMHQWAGLLTTLPHRILGLAAWLLAMAALFRALERWRPLRPQRFWRDDLAADVLYYFLGGILPAFFMVAAAAALARCLGYLMASDVHAWIEQTPLWLRIALAIVLGDVAYYWAHRWSHEIPWLWRFHSVHHSPTRLDWLVNTRAHVFDLVFVRTVAVVPILALGMQRGALAGLETAIAAYLSVSTVLAFFIHANVGWRFGWLEHVVVSPAFHHWHHGNDDANVVNKNYASLLPFIDRLFGTHHLPSERFPASYGLAAARPVLVNAPGATLTA